MNYPWPPNTLLHTSRRRIASIPSKKQILRNPHGFLLAARAVPPSSTPLYKSDLLGKQIEGKLQDNNIKYHQMYPNRRVPIRLSRIVFFSDHQNIEQEQLNQRRTTNLGAMVDLLREHVPMLLQHSLPKSIVSEDVLLRICPSHFDSINAYLPNIRGHVSYYATCKAAQLFLTSLMLNPKAHLHIESFRTSKNADHGCCLAHSTKIYVRWSTCSEGCPHLVQEDPLKSDFNSSTSNAKLGSHRWSRIDAGEFSQKSDWSITNSISDLGKGIIGLTKHDSQLERKISGVFIFELNEENDQIAVHTVEDMNIIERHEESNVGDKLRVC